MRGLVDGEHARPLDLGVPDLRTLGHPVEAGLAAPAPRRFQARNRPELVRDLAAMRANVQTRREQVLDARSAGRLYCRLGYRYQVRLPGP